MKLPLWRLTTLRRQLFEFAGSTRHSRPSVGGIEDKLCRYLPDPGVFVEAGALDGCFESNTYYLERFCAWRGVLIEPVPEMFARLAVNRPRAQAFHCALVARDFADHTIPVVSDHAMSHVGHDAGARSQVQVPARTLTSVLDEAGVDHVDLLSLDVEGFEIQVLNGLDFLRHTPRYILVECLDAERKAEMDRFLTGRYRFVETFTYRDFLYAAR